MMTGEKSGRLLLMPNRFLKSGLEGVKREGKSKALHEVKWNRK